MISFTVEGRPATKGSWRPIVRNGKARLIPQLKRSKPWQERVAWSAKAQMRGAKPTESDCEVVIAFVFKRPAKTKLKRPKGDLDKLERAVFDALSGIVYADDDAVVECRSTKRWGEWDGAVVTVIVRTPDEALRAIGASPTPILDMVRAAVTDRPDVLAVLAGEKPRRKR